ncbi:low glucose sensor Snf3p [Monosporozyma unispora]|nr:hypothetical protein C6P44_000305 [Kazachstania unispora]
MKFLFTNRIIPSNSRNNKDGNSIQSGGSSLEHEKRGDITVSVTKEAIEEKLPHDLITNNSSLSLQGYDTLEITHTRTTKDEVDDSASISQEYKDILDKPLPLRSKIMTSLVGLFVAVGGLLFGYDTGLINSVSEMPMFIQRMVPGHSSFTSGQLSIIVSFLSLGTFIGSLSAPFIADRYGRKPTIIVSNIVLFIIGTSLQVTAVNMRMLIVGRVISGIGIGLISAVVPLYQAEAAEKNLRGAIISSYQWTITIGLLISNAIAQSTQNRTDLSAYKIPLSLQYIWSVFLAIGMIFLPESPRYFILKDELNKAAKSLSFLRGIPIDDPRLLEELVEIKATFDYEASFGKTTIWDCFKSSESRPKQRLRIFTGIMIQVFQQFSGINFIFYYGLRFFRTAGMNKPYMISLITYAVNVAFNVPGMFFIEYYGRRNVLLYGGIIMTISNFIVASVGTTIQIGKGVYVVITFICTFIASFSATWGGVVWVISAELFPLGVRSKSTAICAAANWISNFICSLITPYVVSTHAKKSSDIFFIWGAINALSVLVVYFTVYETSGLRLEEITALYRESSNCFDSTKYNKIIRDRPILKSNQPAVDLLNDIQRREQKDEERHTKASKIGFENNAFEKTNEADFSQVDLDNRRVSSDNSLGEAEFYMSKVIPRQRFSIRLSPHDSVPLSEDHNKMTGQIVDLGNGLGLNTYKRGPPSILSESSVEYDGEITMGDATVFNSYGSSSSDGKKKNKFKETVTQFPDSSSHTSQSTNYSSFLNGGNSQPQPQPQQPLQSQFFNINNVTGRYSGEERRSSLNTMENSSNNSYNGVDWGQYLRRPSETSSFFNQQHANTTYPYSQFHANPTMHINMTTLTNTSNTSNNPVTTNQDNTSDSTPEEST